MSTQSVCRHFRVPPGGVGVERGNGRSAAADGESGRARRLIFLDFRVFSSSGNARARERLGAPRTKTPCINATTSVSTDLAQCETCVKPFGVPGDVQTWRNEWYYVLQVTREGVGTVPRDGESMAMRWRVNGESMGGVVSAPTLLDVKH